MLLVLLVAAALGGAARVFSDQVSAAPAQWLTLAVMAGVVYAALRARPDHLRALGRTFSSLRRCCCPPPALPCCSSS